MPDISLIAMIGAAPMSGIVCSAYRSSRFGSLPVPYDTAPPGGAADAVATSGDAFGGPGRVSLTVPTFEEYWVAVPSGGHIGWVKSPSPVVPESDVTSLIADLATTVHLAGAETMTGSKVINAANPLVLQTGGVTHWDLALQVGTEKGASGGLVNGLMEIVQQIAPLNNQHDLMLLGGGTADIRIGHKGAYTATTVTASGTGVTSIQVASTAQLLPTAIVDIGAGNLGISILAVPDATHFTVAAPITVANTDAVKLYSTGQLFLDTDVRIEDLTNTLSGHRGHGMRLLDGGNNVLIEFPYSGNLTLVSTVLQGQNGANNNLLMRMGSAAGIMQVTNFANTLAILQLSNAGTLGLTGALNVDSIAPQVGANGLGFIGAAGGTYFEYGTGGAAHGTVWYGGGTSAVANISIAGLATFNGGLSIAGGTVTLPAASVAPGALQAIPESGVTSLVTDLGLKAPLASPTFTGTVTLADGVNIPVGITTGSQLGTAAAQKLAFHGATSVIQRAGAAQAAAATTTATQTTPWGFSTAAQANALVTLVNELRAAVVEKGLIKGAA